MLGVELGVEAGLVVGLKSEQENTLIVAGVAGVETELRLLGSGGKGGAGGGSGMGAGSGWGRGGDQGTPRCRHGLAVIRRAELRSRLELAEVVERLLQ